MSGDKNYKCRQYIEFLYSSTGALFWTASTKAIVGNVELIM